MKKAVKNWLLVAFMVVMSAGGALPGTAIAGDVSPCAQPGAPMRLQLPRRGGSVVGDGNGDMEITAYLTNCTATEWSGSVLVTITGGPDPSCFTTQFTPQPLTVRPGQVETTRFRSAPPACVGYYDMDGVAYNASGTAATVHYTIHADYPPPRTRA
jgi:hypothetical protein